MNGCTFEMVCVGPPVFGEWFAVPAVLLPAVVASDEDPGVVLTREGFETMPDGSDSDFISIEHEEGAPPLFYPATPAVVFTIRRDDIEAMRERVRAGADAELVMMEFYANAHHETYQAGE